MNNKKIAKELISIAKKLMAKEVKAGDADTARNINEDALVILREGYDEINASLKSLKYVDPKEHKFNAGLVISDVNRYITSRLKDLKLKYSSDTVAL